MPRDLSGPNANTMRGEPSFRVWIHFETPDYRENYVDNCKMARYIQRFLIDSYGGAAVASTSSGPSPAATAQWEPVYGRPDMVPPPPVKGEGPCIHMCVDCGEMGWYDYACTTDFL